MLVFKKEVAFSLLLIVFVFISSFLGTSQSEGDGVVLKLYALPEFIASVALYLYFFMVAVFSLVGVLAFIKGFKVYVPILMLMLSYFILAFWAVATLSEYIRYIVTFFSIALCPIGIAYILERVELRLFAKLIGLVFFILLALSAMYSFLNLSIHPRVYGIYNNPNLIGMWLVSYVALFLYFKRFLSGSVVFVLIVLALSLVLLTGSRLAFCLFVFLLIPLLLRNKLLLLGLISLALLLFSMSGMELDLRSMDVTNAVSDSGRIFIWGRAIECIAESPLVGHGMFGARDCVDVANVHNSYLRIAVMLGLPLTIIFFGIFLCFIITIFMMPVNPFVRFYFASLPVAFFAEDYIVGFASPFFPFYILMLSLLLLDLNRGEDVSRAKV